MRWLRCALLVVCLTTLGGCDVARPSPHDMSPGVDPAGVSPTLPDGWRWESYRDVEVGVPADWGWGSGEQRLGQWCINERHPKPIVGRPGFSTLVGCPSAKPAAPDPETLIANTGWIVAFEDARTGTGGTPLPHGGDRQVVTLGHVTVVVQAPESMRTTIIATIHLMKIDHHGCPASDAVTAHPGRRPRASSVTTLSDVSAVSVCKYAIARKGDQAPKAGLLSSSSYRGSSAAKIVREIADSPVRGGPNNRKVCTYTYGDEIIVLRVTSSTGVSEIYARYSGCDHNGFDDGIAVRRLTRAPMQALIAGANAVSSWDGFLGPILDPRP
ncbi:MAG: hypothetical protein JWQ70_818 [Aeromicrobium sp.]|nr:hypothetical protein [Aeromicrobium sp.]